MRKLVNLVIALALIMTGAANAEQKRTLGQWDVHYMAVATTFLTPEIAKANNIVRSENNLLINISVLDRYTQKAQLVEATGTARNLLGNTKTLVFKEVVEGDAIYYLAVMSFDDEEHYRFEITLSQSKVEQVLKFEQKVYR